MTIRLQSIHFAYQSDRPVLRGLDLTVERGQLVGLLGANGAGKTTTFRLLVGLLRPDGGVLEIAGVSVLADPREVKRRAGYLPDEPMLYPTLSALENLDLIGRLWGVAPSEAQQRGEQLVREVGLWEVRNQWVRSYSRGMRQKLALCAALLHEPRVLLLDEPFAGLDVEAGLWARELLRGFAAGGGAVLFSSHVPELIDSFADRVVLLHGGRAVYDQPREMARRDGGMVAVFQRFAGSRDPNEAARDGGGEES